MNLQELREKIDEVDGQLVQLIEQRMDIAGQIADYKKENHLPVLDAAREREKLARVSAVARPDMQDYTRVLYSLLFELSRSYQSRLVANTTEQYELFTTPSRIRRSCFQSRHRLSARASMAPSPPWPASESLPIPM